MRNTTADYKLEINKPSRSFECKITIGNNIYTNEDLVNLTLEYAQPQEGFAIGNTISQSLDLTLLNRGDIIYSTSQIKVEIGLKIGSTIEYILMGIFNIDDIEKTDYTTKFTAYDNMIKFETPYFSSLGDKPTLKQVVNELSKLTGVEFTGSLLDYNLSKLEGFTCREVLSYVASICGGNAFITRDGKFTIKSLSEVEKAIDGNNYFDYTREEVKYKVGKISCQVDENNILSKGSTGTDSMELGFENPWITEAILNDVYNKLNGLSYLGYSMKWQGDLSLDPYDIITVTDIKNVVRKIPILSQKISYTGGLTSEIGAKGETKNKNSFSSSGSTTNKVNRLVTEQAVIKEALIEKANIKDVEAVSIRTQTLEAKTAKLEEAIIDVAHISDLNVINANIEKLIAADATINNALIGKADITELNAVKGTINVLESDTANIKNLLAGNISGESGQLIHLTASNVVIADAVIKDLIAANISVEDLKASTISTNKFSIASTDGGLSIVGPTMQFKDKNNKVRIQMGQDATGSFNFILRGEDGTTTLIDHTGIKEKAIADDLIKSNMVAADAIGEKQINYSSLITGLNKDTNTSLIKASKVAIDLTGQSLEVSFNSLKSNVDNMDIGGRNLLLNSKMNYLPTGGSGTTVYKELIEDPNHGTVLHAKCLYIYQANFLKMSSIPIVGEKYLITFFAKSLNSSTFRCVIHSGLIAFSSEAYIKTYDTWGKCTAEITIKNVPDGNPNLYFYPDNDEYWIKDIKIEKGDKATDWTPAPEDVDNEIESNTTAISVAQGKIEGLISENSIIKSDVTTISDKYTSLKATVDGINTTVASHTSSIGTINTNISGLSGKVTKVENNYASLSQDLSGFKTTVANNYSTKTELSTVDEKVSSLTSRVSTAESSITQLNNKIALKIEATDVTEAINNIKIGTKNLLLGTKDWKYGQGVGTITTETYHGCKVLHKDNSTGTSYVDIATWSNVIVVKPNTEYTLSFYAKGKGSFTSFFHPSSVASGYSSEGVKTSSIDGNTQHTLTSEWKRYWITWKTLSNASGSKSIIAMRLWSGSIGYICGVKFEEGNKATDFTVATEDVDSSIANVQTQVTTTSNKVATIETNLSSITQRVSSTESTVSTHTSQLSTVDSRINTAKNSAISTAANDATSKANMAQTNAINSAKGYTDGQITTVNQTITNKVAEIKATTDSITSSVSKVEQIATSSLQGKMIFTDPTFKSGSNSIGTYNNASNGNVVVSRVAKSSDCPTTSSHMIQITTNGTASPGHGGFYWGNMARANAIFITKIIAKIPSGCTLNWISNSTGTGGKAEWLTSNAGTGSWKEYIFKVTCGSSGSFSSTNYFYLSGGSAPVTWYLAFATVFDITETSNIESRMESAEQKITPTAITTTISSVITGGTGSISTTQFVMDKNGLTINNGALRIKNKSGTTVLNSDTNGNLIITGEMRSQYGQQWVGLNAGGLTFQDWNRNEQMLRVGLSYFESNRDMNGVNFALAKYGDFIRFSHIEKTDLTNGWSSSDTQYNFFDCWSSEQTVDGATRKKGVNMYAPAYINNGLFFNNTSSTTSDIVGNFTWNNGTGNTTGLLGMCGDNGLFLGYKDGEDYKARMILTETSHPGTGDNIISWGNYNFNGYTFHNASIAANYLTVSGSKNCLQKTKNYGSRLINAYETAEYYFGDLGFGKINTDGECLAYIDDIFLECVNTNAQYHVFTQIYNGKITSIERYTTYVVIKGEPGTDFSWQLMGKRIEYENNRLDTQDIETQGENKIELFGYEDFKVETSEDTLMNVLTFELEDLLLMEG